MSAPVKLALVGLGAVAQLVYLPLLTRRTDRFAVTAVCDPSEPARDAAGAQLGVPPSRRFADLTALLDAGDVEAVALLASGSHGEAARAVTDAGLALLCEKPLAYTLAEADGLADAERLQVGYMKLHDPAVVEARAALPDIGRVRAVEVTVLHPSMEHQLRHLHAPPRPAAVDAAVRSSWAEATARQREQALGPAAEPLGALYTEVLLGSVVHDLALVRALVGDPVAVDFAESWPVDGWPPSVAFSAGLPGGARLTMGWHHLPDYPEYRESVRVHGEDGSVSVAFPSPYLLHAPTRLLVDTDAGRGARRVEFRSTVEAFERQLLAFYDVVREGARPAAGVAEGRADIVTCQRIAACLARRRGIPHGGEAA